MRLGGADVVPDFARDMHETSQTFSLGSLGPLAKEIPPSIGYSGLTLHRLRNGFDCTDRLPLLAERHTTPARLVQSLQSGPADENAASSIASNRLVRYHRLPEARRPIPYVMAALRWSRIGGGPGQRGFHRAA